MSDDIGGRHSYNREEKGDKTSDIVDRLKKQSRLGQ